MKNRITDVEPTSVAPAGSNAVLPAGWTISKVIELRQQLPVKWKWEKCYELVYISSRTGREFSKRHWALKDVNDENKVCSLGMISHDANSTKKEFFENDKPVEFVEKSLEIIDFLLAEIERLQACR